MSRDPPAPTPRRQQPVLCGPDRPRQGPGRAPGRERAATSAKAAKGLLPARTLQEARYSTPTLADLGYINLSATVRRARKRPKGGELT